MIKQQAGFTLIEVMVVVVILGILGAMIIPQLMSRPEQAKVIKAKQDIQILQSALDLYRLDNGFYPTTDQGLEALVKKPETPPAPANWKTGGYIRHLPHDPWGHSYQYINTNNNLKIFSEGPKGGGDNGETTGEGIISNDEDTETAA